MAMTSIPRLARKISERCNYIDPELAEAFYTGFLKVIVEGLRTDGEITLPGWGKFRIVEHKGRRLKNVNTGLMDQIPPVKTVKFEPCTRLKNYAKEHI